MAVRFDWSRLEHTTADAMRLTANKRLQETLQSNKKLSQHISSLEITSLEFGEVPPFVELQAITPAIEFPTLAKTTAGAGGQSQQMSTPPGAGGGRLMPQVSSEHFRSAVSSPHIPPSSSEHSLLQQRDQQLANSPSRSTIGTPDNGDTSFADCTEEQLSESRRDILVLGGGGAASSGAGRQHSISASDFGGSESPAGSPGDADGPAPRLSTASSQERTAPSGPGVRRPQQMVSVTDQPERLLQPSSVNSNAPSHTRSGAGGRATTDEPNSDEDGEAVDTLAAYIGPTGLYLKLHATYGGDLSIAVKASVKQTIPLTAGCNISLHLPVRFVVSKVQLDAYLNVNLHRNACQIWFDDVGAAGAAGSGSGSSVGAGSGGGGISCPLQRLGVVTLIGSDSKTAPMQPCVDHTEVAAFVVAELQAALVHRVVSPHYHQFSVRLPAGV